MIRHRYHQEPLSVRLNALKVKFQAEAVVKVKDLTDEQAARVIGFLSPVDLNLVASNGADNVALKIATRRWVSLEYLRQHPKEKLLVPMAEGTMRRVKAVAGNLFAVVSGIEFAFANAKIQKELDVMRAKNVNYVWVAPA